MGNYCQYVSTNFRHHNNTSTTNTSKEAGRITKYDNSARSSPNPKRDVKGNEMVGNALILKENRSMVLGAEEVIVETSTEVTEEDHRGLPKVILLPHQHTLFCERKQRVCTAVGRSQELEVLKLTGNLSELQWVWFRTKLSNLPKDHIDSSSYTVVNSTENKFDYTLGIDDVGFYIGVLYEQKDGKKIFHPSKSSSRADGLIGPILPGPPRLLDFVIAGDLYVGGYAKAEGRYIGGVEGPSEYWWLKVSADGKRSQITEPKAIPWIGAQAIHNPDNDPRYYKLTPGKKVILFCLTDLLHCNFADDIGCTLKSKCRPIRTDKVAGEIFTSKSSAVIAKAKPKASK